MTRKSYTTDFKREAASLVLDLRIPRQRDRRFQPNVTGHSDGS